MLNTSALADARAAQLAGHRDAVRELLAAAGDAREQVAAVLLGRQDRVELPLATDHPALRTVVSTLRYSGGASIIATPAGPASTKLVSADLIADVRSGGSVAALLDPAGRRRLFGPAPVLVLSTAGDPELVRETLRVHLAAAERFGHTDLRLLVVDDAHPDRSAELAEVISQARAGTRVPLIRFAEHSPDGAPGPKARFRDALRAAVGDEPTLETVADRVLSSSAAGSANAAFLLLGGRPLLWLEQDATPEVWHRDGPAGSEVRASTTVPIEWSAESPDPPSGAERTDVDVVGVVDRALYGPPAAPTYQELAATWEHTGFHAVSGPPEDPLQPRLCYFHLCGHTDYRARFSHHVVVRGRADDDIRRQLLGGGLDRFAVLTRPPDPVVVRQGAMTFGTAVGFHHDLPLPAPMMMVSRQRLFDFSVAAILRSAGECPAAIAGTGLTHRRAEATTSGRGWLPTYLASEELLWPTYHALVDALASVPPRGALPAERWLGLLSAAVRDFAHRYRIPAAATRRSWLSRLDDQLLAEESDLPPEVREYLRLLPGHDPDDWLGMHRRLSAELRTDLLAFADQLNLYAAFGPEVLRRARAAVPAVTEALE